MGGRKERLLCLTAGGFVVAVPLFFVPKAATFLSLSGGIEKQASSHPPYRCVIPSKESRTLAVPPLLCREVVVRARFWLSLGWCKLVSSCSILSY